eukprot:Sdes_comp19895_c0_seq1m12243
MKKILRKITLDDKFLLKACHSSTNILITESDLSLKLKKYISQEELIHALSLRGMISHQQSHTPLEAESLYNLLSHYMIQTSLDPSKRIPFHCFLGISSVGNSVWIRSMMKDLNSCSLFR